MNLLALGIGVDRDPPGQHLRIHVTVPATNSGWIDENTSYRFKHEFARWTWILSHVEAHELANASVLRQFDRPEPFERHGVTVTSPMHGALEINQPKAPFPFNCIVPDVLRVVLQRELRKMLAVVGLPHNIDLETGLDEGMRPWRGGTCVCQPAGCLYHGHHDQKPHACTRCGCSRWRLAQEESR